MVITDTDALIGVTGHSLSHVVHPYFECKRPSFAWRRPYGQAHSDEVSPSYSLATPFVMSYPTCHPL